MNILDRAYLTMQQKANNAKDKIKEFFTSEAGVSNVVATILILLIVVVLVGVFWKQLSGWVGGLMKKIFDPENTNFTSKDVTG